jgi:hypothetical protein
MIYATKNSNKFPKTRFWKGKSIENVVTLGPMAHARLVSMKEGILFFFILSCNYEIHQTKMLQIVFLVSLESSQ